MYRSFDLSIFQVLLLVLGLHHAYGQTPKWGLKELEFTSTKEYTNPLYDLDSFYLLFIAPSGHQYKIHGFWDGGLNYKARFSPMETGTWEYRSACSDTANVGLHDRVGTFLCTPADSSHTLAKKGTIVRNKGSYHLSYSDGTPFFYTACTAWNGALKSTREEWETYLQHRSSHHYNVIQFVATQWRGCERDRIGEVAFSGSGRIAINPAFFQRLDEKFDRINAYGLVAAPVLLWALPFGQGRHLSPGYYLPENEAVLLARYMVARYGGHQVIWMLGGDGRYTNEYEQRWKQIGRRVFGDDPPGIVAQHPHGSLWIGDTYRDEAWLDIVGYQSSHSNGESVVDWINKGPMATRWSELPPKPIINLEPNYEEIHFRITDEDVRNASYWSVFATPPGGITYGANGIWPWIQQKGELVENHTNPGGKGPSTWRESIDFPGSLQIGYLSAFMQRFEWWHLRPMSDLLHVQPGNEQYNDFISVLADPRLQTILAYSPRQQSISLNNRLDRRYHAQWFDPVHNRYQPASLDLNGPYIRAVPPEDRDFVLILQSD